MMRSGSKQLRKSVGHIGTVPCKFKIDVFVSYIDHIKNAAEVCVTWERRGKVQATSIAKVKDSKAVIRETMSIESTLFKRNARDKGKKGQADSEQLKFDEKKVKFVLRKGGPDGKAIGKIAMNIAEYVHGVNSTVFADLKLSNGSVIVSKIEASMLHMGRKANGSNAGSEVYSEMSESNSFDADSLFGDEEDLSGDLEGPSAWTSTSKPEAEVPGSKVTMSPISTAPCSPAGSPQVPVGSARAPTLEPGTPSSRKEDSGRQAIENESEDTRKRRPTVGEQIPQQLEDELKSSPSLRQKLRNKLKERTSGRKDRPEDAESSDVTSLIRKPRPSRMPTNESEVKELRLLVESLKEENAKLRRGKQAAMDEIDALRSDLEACENALEDATQRNDFNNSGTFSESDVKSLNARESEIAALSAQNQHLIDELEEAHQEEVQSSQSRRGDKETIKTLRKRIEDLEVALRREPQFLDVVNELKVTKVSLALANMEKEQAVFALNTLKQDLGVDD